MKIVYILAFLSTLITACKKKEDKDPVPQNPIVVGDTTKPIITLIGNKKDTILLQSTYSDPGATALDNKDGDITAFIVVTGTVNANHTGDYLKKYKVKDVAGNISEEVRNVHVKNSVEFLNGSYLVSCNCATVNSGPGGLTFTKSITYNTTIQASDSLNENFIINNVDVGNTSQNSFKIYLNKFELSGWYYSIPAGLHSLVLSGKMAPSYTSFTLTTSVQNSMHQGKSCTNSFTRQ